MRKINKIIIHCTATESGKDYSVDDIRKWHLSRGFKDVGYHYIIHLDGTVSLGRSPHEPGAHCAGYNKHSIGICYVGGLLNGKPADTRTDSQKKSLITLLNMMRCTYGDVTIHGHKEFANKACPCFDVNELRKEVFKNVKKD